MNKYIIVNAETIQQRINYLEKVSPLDRLCYDGMIECEEMVLKEILSNSKPLEEELSKAIESSIQSFESNAYEVPERIEEIKQDYINNLKLDI